MKHFFDLRRVHKKVAAAAGQGKFRVAEQARGTEQRAFHPQTAPGRGRYDPQVRRQDRQDPVGLPHLDLAQHQTRCCNLHIRPPVLRSAVFYTLGSHKCCRSAQNAASRPPHCPCRHPHGNRIAQARRGCWRNKGHRQISVTAWRAPASSAAIRCRASPRGP